MLNPLQYQFSNTLKVHGYDAIVNGEDQVRVLLKEYMERTSTLDYKYILFENKLGIKQGDIITVLGDKWLVIHEDITINDVYTKVIIRRLKFNINFIVDSKVFSFPTAIDDGTYRIEESKFFATNGGSIVLFVQENATTSKIAKGDRFLIMGNAWKIIQKTNTEHGIIKVYADVDIYEQGDDLENEIPNTDKLDPEPETPTEPEIPIDPDPEEPLEPEEDDFTIEIMGEDRFGLMTETTFTAKVLNNNVEVSDKQVVFSVSSTLAIIKSQSDNVCRLETNKQFKTGTFVLTATLIEDETIFTEKTVIITGL